MKNLLLPVLLAALFILESVFVQLFSGQFIASNWLIVPHFLLVAIIFIAIYVGEKYGVLYGLIFGLLFDVVYTEILGVYLFLFPILAYVIAKLMKFLHNHVVISTLMSMIGVIILEVVVYEIHHLIRLTDMLFLNFLVNRLFPTVVLNIAFLIIFAVPLKKSFEKFAIQLRNN